MTRDADLAGAAEGTRPLRWWLVATAVAVVGTIAVGGATRLTESGLSITEWQPITGVVPPLTETAWEAAYQQYLRIPQAQTVHAGITIDQFRAIYWWEWAHRLVARAVGLVVLIPFLALWWRRRIPPGLLVRMAALPLLVLAQGALGWYMVRSGLAERTSVSPYRLVAHLGLALLIFGIAVWTASALWPGARERATAGVRRTLALLAAGVLVTMMSGGFVAGLDAGKIFNEFPLMGGRVVPDGYAGAGGWRNLFENPIAAQFNHRALAVVLTLAIWAAWLAAERRWSPVATRWV
ncbi:MAG: COX15/CtaA family protein, partial [Gemmatimonadaceae bacterium]|nr:COX15/CtaA family protein [Gemmatimonadaceae bacterium]